MSTRRLEIDVIYSYAKKIKKKHRKKKHKKDLHAKLKFTFQIRNTETDKNVRLAAKTPRLAAVLFLDPGDGGDSNRLAKRR